MHLLTQYWPVLIFIGWFAFKWWSTQKIKKMIPELKNKGAIIIDVRSQAEFASGHNTLALNIPLPQLSQRLKEIPRNLPIIVCCASGARSGVAKSYLLKSGWNEVYNAGAWTNT